MWGRRVILALTVVLAAAASFAARGCGRTQPARPHGPIRIVVSVPPLKRVAERLAPNDAEVLVWTPLGASPHGYEPPPDRVRALVQADVVVLVGAGLDRSASRLLEVRPRQWRRVVTLASFTAGGADEAHDHAHGGGHTASDPHLWLDADVMRRTIPALREAIAAAQGERTASEEPEDPSASAENSLLEEVEAIDQAYADALGPAAGTGVVALHGGAGPLLERYGLDVVVTIDGHHIEPSPTQIADAAAALREGRASIVVKDPNTPVGLAERLAERAQAPVVLLDPIGDEDWTALMRRNLGSLVNGLRAAGALGDQPPPSSAPAGSTGGGM